MRLFGNCSCLILGGDHKITTSTTAKSGGLGMTTKKEPCGSFCLLAFGYYSPFAALKASAIALPNAASSCLFRVAITSCSSASSFALIDRLITRFLRSTPVNFASTLSPTFRISDASSIHGHVILQKRGCNLQRRLLARWLRLSRQLQLQYR